MNSGRRDREDRKGDEAALSWLTGRTSDIFCVSRRAAAITKQQTNGTFRISKTFIGDMVLFMPYIINMTRFFMEKERHMSAVVVLLPVMIPAAAAAWPAVVTAATAATAAMGYRVVSNYIMEDAANEIELEVERSQEVTQGLARGDEISFKKDDAQVIFFRNPQGKVGVKVCAKGKSDDELRAIGKAMVDGVTQQYTYNRLMTELKERNFNVVGQEVEEDGTVRLQVRVFHG